MIRRLLACAVVLGACSAAHADFRTGNKLLNEINDSNFASNGLALGYIMGIADANGGVLFCLPTTVTAGQLQDMVKQFLTENPSVRHMAAESLISYVLSKSWPCANRSGSQKGNAL